MENILPEIEQCEYNGTVQEYDWDLYYVYHRVKGDSVKRLIVLEIIAVIIIVLWDLLMCYNRKAAIIIFIGALIGAIGYRGIKICVENNMWYNQNTYIAHAMGGIREDNISYTNCLEAYEENYNNGFKIFEVDFSITADDQIVLIHDWENALGRIEQ